MGDLAAPCAVAFGKAVEEDQRGRIAPLNRPWPLINHIEFDPVREFDPFLLHAHPSASIFSIYPAATMAATWSKSASGVRRISPIASSMPSAMMISRSPLARS